MASINEELIRTVFSEMLEFRPSLSKYSLVDEEDEEEVDHRVLANQIIRNFPWPVGVELRRLFSAGMRSLSRLRLDQIFKTIERSMQFISFVMLSQLWHDIRNGEMNLPGPLAGELTDRIRKMGMGDFAWVIRTMGTLYQQSEQNWFMPEMKEKLDKKALSALDFWVPERNEIGHYQINLTQEEIEKRCVEYEEKLTFILARIAFLSKYRLVSVREIRVNKPKYRDPKFLHIVDLLNSSDSDFAAREIDEDTFAESHSVLLVKSVKSLDHFLNLSPLIIDTHSEVLDNKEKFGIKKDIFLYSKRKEGNLMYVGTEVTEKCDLRALSFYPQLQDEFNALMQTIQPAETRIENG